MIVALHRRVQEPLRSRADLPGAVRARHPDRCEHLQRDPQGAGVRGPAGRRVRGEQPRGPVPVEPTRVRRSQAMACRPARRPGHRPRPGRPADAHRRDRGRRPRPARHHDHASSWRVVPRHPDLVERAWNTPSRPDHWWVADFTYVWTVAAFCYVALLSDVFSRRILGWRVATSDVRMPSKHRRAVDSWSGTILMTPAGKPASS